MFKSITYLNYTYDNSIQKYIYYYHLVDTDFECDVSVVAAWLRRRAVARAVGPMAAAVASEYHKRNLNIIKNLYLLNNYILKDWYPSWSFEQLLNYQNEYIDKYYKIDGINFSKEIYPGVKELYKTLGIFK